MTAPLAGEKVEYPVGQKLGAPPRAPLTKEEHEAHAKRQADAAKETLRRKGVSEAEIAQRFNTLLTTKEHVGTHPAEPIKHDHVEARKSGKTEDAPDVETIDLHSNVVDSEGNVTRQHTDTLVVNPPNPLSRGEGASTRKLNSRAERALDKSGKGRKADADEGAEDKKHGGKK